MSISRRAVLAAMICIAPASVMLPSAMHAQSKSVTTKKDWRAATPAELEAVLPARAQVEKEHIETEMRTATGVIDAHGHVVAAVVLITAGYAANGKYYYYLLAQAPIRIGTDIALGPGTYAIGWTRETDGLLVHVYEAETGVPRGNATARPMSQPLPVVSIKVWPPAERSVIQIGRFALPYSLEE
jgi:hypothetical protein